MAKRASLLSLFIVLSVAVAAVALACGGGKPADNASKGERIVDPALVPSSTPIQNPALYLLRADGHVETTGGVTSTIPASGTAPASAGGSYTVVANDTCGGIAAAHNVTVEEIKRLNRTIDAACGNLHEGDVIKIPGVAAATATPANATTTAKKTTVPAGGGGKTYTIVSGDTCEGIATAHNVKVADLISLNHLDAACQGLKPDQVLQLP